MAEIDKGLPNVKTKLEVPAEEKLQEVAVQDAIEEQENPKIEVTPEEDGGVTLDFEPGSINVPGTEAHFDNLADILPDDVLEPIGNDMVQNYVDYKSSRKDWERS
jgi:desulfoferrodoxin (superoxide reductase-like protein)